MINFYFQVLFMLLKHTRWFKSNDLVTSWNYIASSAILHSTHIAKFGLHMER